MSNAQNSDREDEFGQTIIVVTDDKGPRDGANETKTENIELDRKEFKIRLADTEAGRSSASMLINTMYSWRGYAGTHQIPASLNQITLTASDKDKVVGTITLGIDSPVGIFADDIFKDEIDRARQKGRKVCELTKLAFAPDIRSKRVLAATFHIIFIYLYHLHKCDDIFIEVNPRHRLFYEKLLGFRQVGEEKLNTRVNAPAFLLWAETEYVQEQIRILGGGMGHGLKSKSLYPYFYSEREAAGIAGRLSREQP